jgi:uncharacterized protein (DUF488 family)
MLRGTGAASAPFFTIGHSNRPLQDFTDLLRASAIEQVMDVRRLPGSARYPQFNDDILGSALAESGIHLVRLEALTGRRPVSKVVPFEVNAFWQNRSFHNFADHALSADFRAALAALRQAGGQLRTAVMCSEAVWWRCHRRIIADHLLAHGEDVRHILGANQVKPAELTAGAVVHSDESVTYPLPPSRD